MKEYTEAMERLMSLTKKLQSRVDRLETVLNQGYSNLEITEGFLRALQKTAKFKDNYELGRIISALRVSNESYNLYKFNSSDKLAYSNSSARISYDR